MQIKSLLMLLCYLNLLVETRRFFCFPISLFKEIKPLWEFFVNSGDSNGGGNSDGTGDTGDTDDEAPEGTIYGKGVVASILGAFDIHNLKDSERITYLVNTIGKSCGVYPVYTPILLLYATTR